jgi:hypothetical protein
LVSIHALFLGIWCFGRLNLFRVFIIVVRDEMGSVPTMGLSSSTSTSHLVQKCGKPCNLEQCALLQCWHHPHPVSQSW